MAASSDLVSRLHLETVVDGKSITHFKFKSNLSTGQRRVRYEETWEREDYLGHGGSGTVFLERRRDDKTQVRAVKLIAKQPGTFVAFNPLDEAIAMSILSHPQNEGLFVTFHGWFETHDNLCLVMEYLENSDLDKYLSKNGALTEIDSCSVTKQLLEGLKVIHDAGFVHRDLKPGNILIQHKSPWWVKIGDFGISRRLENLAMTFTGVGTHGYVAPEVELNERTHHTNAVDMWSLGCVIYKMLTNQLPFANSRAVEIFCKNSHDFYESIDGIKSLSDSCKTLLKQLLVAKPGDRASVDTASNMSWILETNDDLVESEPAAPKHVQPVVINKLPDADTGGNINSIKDISKSAIPPPSQDLAAVTEPHAITSPTVQPKVDPSTRMAKMQARLEASQKSSQEYVAKLRQQAVLERRLEVEKSQERIAEAIANPVKPNEPLKPHQELCAICHKPDIRSTMAVLDCKHAFDHKCFSEVVSLSLESKKPFTCCGKWLEADKVKGILPYNKYSAYSDMLDRTELPRPKTPGPFSEHEVHEAIQRIEKLDLNNSLGLLQSVQNEDAPAVWELLRQNIRTSARDPIGMGTLHWAADKGHAVITGLLLDKDADIEMTDKDSKTPLHFAVMRGHLEVVEVLLNRGAKSDARSNETFRTPSHYAALGGHKAILKMLLEKGCDINQSDRESRTCLHLAAWAGHLQTVQFLVDHGAQINAFTSSLRRTPTYFAAERGHLEVVTFLIHHGADVDKGRAMTTPLHGAASGNQIEVMKMLLDYGVSVDIKEEGEETPLHIAALAGSLGAIQFLLEHRADINAKEGSGHTPLFNAVTKGQRLAVQLLLKSGAHPSERGGRSRTPLHIAALEGYKDIVLLLLEKGAVVDIKDHFQDTPLMLAKVRKHKEIIELLEAAESGTKKGVPISTWAQKISRSLWPSS